MKELFDATSTKPPEVILNKFSESVSVSFFLFPCSKEQAVRVYLDTIQMNLVTFITLIDVEKGIKTYFYKCKAKIEPIFSFYSSHVYHVSLCLSWPAEEDPNPA